MSELNQHIGTQTRLREITAWVKQGLIDGRQTTRWGNLFGANTRVTELSNTAIEIETKHGIYQVHLTKIV